jgi:ABC-type sugar transport system substrate-binding protein
MKIVGETHTVRKLAGVITGSLLTLTSLAMVVGTTDTAASAATSTFKVCMGTAGTPGTPWQTGQGTVLQDIAHQEGWASVVLSNQHSPSTSLSNAEIFVLDKCNAVIEGPSPESTDPVIAAKLAAAKIPVITFDIAQKGWYFVGINNSLAGIQGGEALGAIIKSKWDCNLDEVIASGLPVVGVIDTERTGGMIKGIQKVCPNIPNSKTTEFDGDGEVSASATAGRALLAAHPSWVKIAVVGINDDGVVGVLEAAEQLGRAKDMIGWGQSGDLDTGSNIDPHLLGSVFYFLEGYAEYAVPLLKEIAAGHAPAVADYTHNNPAVLIAPCSASTAQAKNIPGYSARLAKLATVSAGTTPDALFCPKM